MSSIVRIGNEFKVNFKLEIKQDYRGDLRVLHGVDSFQIDSRRGNMGLEWSWVVSAGV